MHFLYEVEGSHEVIPYGPLLGLDDVVAFQGHILQFCLIDNGSLLLLLGPFAILLLARLRLFALGPYPLLRSVFT